MQGFGEGGWGVVPPTVTFPLQNRGVTLTTLKPMKLMHVHKTHTGHTQVGVHWGL